MKAMQETTVWADTTRNHLYWLDGDKALAYVKSGENTPFYFSKPMVLNLRHRKFVEVAKHPFKQEANADIVIVKGSNGAEYEVNRVERTCTCPASKYHKGECKHVKEVCK